MDTKGKTHQHRHQDADHVNWKFGPLALIKNINNKLEAFHLESVDNKKPKPFLFDGKKAETLEVFEKQNLLLVQTPDGFSLWNFANELVRKLPDTIDYYYEPSTAQFWRKSSNGTWFDQEGTPLPIPILITDDVLVLLEQKRCKHSIGFFGEKVKVSLHHGLIQVGKVVYNQDLQPVTIPEDKISGILGTNIKISENQYLQAVKIGASARCFIDEFTAEAFRISGNLVNNIRKDIPIKNVDLIFFESNNRCYLYNIKTHLPLSYEGTVVPIHPDSPVVLAGELHVKIDHNNQAYYLNVNRQEPTKFPLFDNQKIIHIDSSSFELGPSKYWNIQSEHIHAVYSPSESSLFKLANGLAPNSIEEVPGFEKFLGAAIIKNRSVLFSLDTLLPLSSSKDDIEVQELNGLPKQKLINATTTDGISVVLDAREGLSNLKIAYSENVLLSAVSEAPLEIGTSVIQNAKLQTLGGTRNVVVDLNQTELPIYRLSEELKASPDGRETSIFATSEVESFDASKIVTLNKLTFLQATFTALHNQFFNCLIDIKTGEPWQLEGASQKYELVTSMVSKDYSIPHIGPYKMSKANVLSQDFRATTLLFDAETLKSSLLFNDTFLPGLRRMINLDEAKGWQYYLFEISTFSEDKEYLVVEKLEPYRILVEISGKKEQPKFIQSTTQELRQPEKISSIKKIFLSDPGYLRAFN